MPRNLGTSAFMKPLVVLALPGMYLFYKYSQYKRQQQEQNRRRVTERELAHLNHKIDKLLTKLEENEPEIATSQEDECVICVNAKATMQTSPCGHRVVCRKCFVKTIQMAVSQRLLPLRCVICRAKILRLKQSVRLPSSLLSKDAAAVAGGSSSSRSSSSSSSSWLVNSASRYSMGPVPNSESLYSMSSGSSSLSGVSSSSGSSTGSAGIRNYPRQPTGALKISQTHSMKYHLQEYKEPRTHSSTQVSSINGGGLSSGSGPEKRLPPIQEFQRDFRLGRDRSTSTRIRCAQKIVTQLEIGPVITATTSNTIKISTSSSSGFFRGGGKTGGVSGSDLSSGEKKRFGSASQSKEPAPQIKKDAKGDSKTPYTRLLEEKDKETEPTKDGRKIEKTEKTTKGDKKEKNKEKELTKAEKKEQKKEAKAEKKAAKKEAKNDKKKE